MKKLFFAALLATVAVGGAYAQYSSSPNSPADKTCLGTLSPLCGASTYFPNSPDQAPIAVQQRTARPLQ